MDFLKGIIVQLNTLNNFLKKLLKRELFFFVF